MEHIRLFFCGSASRLFFSLCAWTFVIVRLAVAQVGGVSIFAILAAAAISHL
jgi:hypothetical protein